jgi:hypothetical protein
MDSFLWKMQRLVMLSSSSKDCFTPKKELVTIMFAAKFTACWDILRIQRD